MTSLGAGTGSGAGGHPPGLPLGFVMVSNLQGKCPQCGLVRGHAYDTLQRWLCFRPGHPGDSAPGLPLWVPASAGQCPPSAEQWAPRCSL